MNEAVGERPSLITDRRKKLARSLSERKGVFSRLARVRGTHNERVDPAVGCSQGEESVSDQRVPGNRVGDQRTIRIVQTQPRREAVGAHSKHDSIAAVGSERPWIEVAQRKVGRL